MDSEDVKYTEDRDTCGDSRASRAEAPRVNIAGDETSGTSDESRRSRLETPGLADGVDDRTCGDLARDFLRLIFRYLDGCDGAETSMDTKD